MVIGVDVVVEVVDNVIVVVIVQGEVDWREKK